MEHLHDADPVAKFVHSGWARRRHSLPEPGRILGGISQPLCDFLKTKRLRPLFTIAIDIRQHPGCHRGASILTLLPVAMPQREKVQFM